MLKPPATRSAVSVTVQHRARGAQRHVHLADPLLDVRSGGDRLAQRRRHSIVGVVRGGVAGRLANAEIHGGQRAGTVHDLPLVLGGRVQSRHVHRHSAFVVSTGPRCGEGTAGDSGKFRIISDPITLRVPVCREHPGG